MDDGDGEKIWIERADADLLGSLDPSQQVSQLLPILPTPADRTTTTGGGVPSVSAELPPRSKRITAPVGNEAQSDRERDLARRAKADADRAEFDAEAARRKLSVDEGRWVDAAEVSRVYTRELATLLADIEAFHGSTLARGIANEFGLEFTAVAAFVRQRWREFRGVVSEDARARRLEVENEGAEPQPHEYQFAKEIVDDD
ncbi:hypothetical protein [Bradyrhizobium viridifuturi]|uniref:hypothetical protein n=1 Tax=Bradyrhizobium viridifuturi TaxID=1654716 RepID=UPI00067EAF64|nr:hypothetical protein [Bradyrhizobium viridifuturi]